MIVSTPVNIPKLEPDDWDKWWEIWDTYAKPLEKMGVTRNGKGNWIGFDVHTTKWFGTMYKAPVVDMAKVYPTFHQQIMDSLPPHVGGLRFVQSQAKFKAHRDGWAPLWELRCMMYCDDPSSQWYYKRLDHTDERRLVLPPETNWWAYLDGVCLHGTDFNPDDKKILVQAYFNSPQVITKLAEEGKLKFDPKYQVSYE